MPFRRRPRPGRHFTLSLVAPLEKDLVDLACASEIRRVSHIHRALPEISGHALGISFYQAEFVGNLRVTQIEAHQIRTAVKRRPRRCPDQAGYSLSKGLMVTGENHAGHFIEPPLAIHTAGSLSRPPGVVPAIFGDMRGVTAQACHVTGPTEFSHDPKPFSLSGN